MKNKLIIEQALHGYSHGHHLLAASVQLSKTSQRLMLTLSDLSGSDTHSGFSEYLTGYPLPDDGYYALAKTWYAPEMERPGCAWTHTLLIKFDDLSEVKITKNFLSSFNRPQEALNIENYSNPIKLGHCFGKMNSLGVNNTMTNELGYLIFSIYTGEKSVILPSESACEYEKLILLIWQNQWPRLRRDFSFCTGSLANRKIGEKTLDVQAVPYSLSKSIVRADKDTMLLDDNQARASLSGYPRWVSVATDEMLHEQNEKFKEFIDDVGDVFKEKKYFCKLTQLYIETDARNSIKSINKYLSTAKSIFKKNDSDSIIKNTLEQLFNSFPNKWFAYTNFSSFLQDLSVAQDFDRVILNKSQIKTQLELLWESDKDSTKDLFKKLISKNLNEFGELLLKDFSQLIQPEQLPVLTDMDIGACNVLVGLRSKFALCPKIWHQSKNFQYEILDCIGRKISSAVLSKNIIETILENSSEVLYRQVFSVFGEASIEIILNWCTKSTPQKENMKNWINICKCSPKTCLKWISSNETLDMNLLVSVVSVLDPYSEVVRQNGIKPWLRVSKRLNQKDLNTSSKLALAQFFLPIILTSDETVTDDFAEFSFRPIHNQLMKNQFSYERWTKLESLLPSVSWYNCWDKCKRLRRAMRKKGYCVQLSGHN